MNTEKAEVTQGEVRQEGPAQAENIVRVGARRNWTFYTFLAKKLFLDHDTVEFQALDTAITNAVEAAECLIKNNYATMERISTDSIEMERKIGGKHSFHTYSNSANS